MGMQTIAAKFDDFVRKLRAAGPEVNPTRVLFDLMATLPDAERYTLVHAVFGIGMPGLSHDVASEHAMAQGWAQDKADEYAMAERRHVVDLARKADREAEEEAAASGKRLKAVATYQTDDGWFQEVFFAEKLAEFQFPENGCDLLSCEILPINTVEGKDG
jgi:hypothetical protein